MHEHPILMPAVPPAGHRARLLLQTGLFLILPIVIVVALIVVAASILM
jgi:hypothetical protein